MIEIKPRIRYLLERTRGFSDKLLATFLQPSEWLHQVVPGGNHALWFTGHMGIVDIWLMRTVAPGSATEAPPVFREKFGPKSQPTSNPADYPPSDQVLTFMRDQRSALLQLFDRLPEDEMTRSLSGGPPFIRDVGSAFEFLVFHEGLHAGQVTVARRALEHPPIVG